MHACVSVSVGLCGDGVEWLGCMCAHFSCYVQCVCVDLLIHIHRTYQHFHIVKVIFLKGKMLLLVWMGAVVVERRSILM